MKTKTIFKTLAFAMLMPTMLLTTACSSDELVDTESTETIVKKGYTLPVTVSATREGDEATTRATYNESTRKLEFSEGDKLFVNGGHATAGSFAGTLDYVSDGTFSGTITTENEYSGTIDDLFASAYAYLLPNGYGSYGYLSIDEGNGYDADINDDGSKAFALTKAAAVEQLSKEWAYGYSSGFALEPNNAILNFTISGLAASTEVAVVFSIYDYGELYGAITGNVTTDASGTATFAIGVEGGPDLNDCTLTVGGNAITLVSSSKELEAGKIYNINRSAAPAEPDMTGTPLTLLVTKGGNLMFYSRNSAIGNLKYTVNGGEEQSATKGGTIEGLQKGDVVTLYCGSTQTDAGGQIFEKSRNSIEAQVYGNPMSLLDGTSFATATKVGNRAFANLFERNTFLSNHPTYDLVLPATTLGDMCYYYMFSNCTQLTRTPKLPATTLAWSCYQNMFYGCASLTDAYVAAPYTTSDYEMRYMFYSIPEDQITLHTTADGKAAWDDCSDFSFKAVQTDYPTE